MQEKERERKGKNGRIIKVAGCSPIREGVLLIRPDTTLADVRKFGEECQRRWGITPLQIFLHKDEGHWLGGKPDTEDKESFQVGGKWFKEQFIFINRTFLHLENVILYFKFSSMFFGVKFSTASDSFPFGQKTVYHIFGKSDGIAEFFHSQHLFE